MASVTLNPSGYADLTSMTISSSNGINNSYTNASSTSYTQFTLSTSTTGYVYYTFNTSSIPSSATINSITGTVKVRVSNTSRVTNTVCQLYANTTAKGSNVTFASTSTSNTVTLSPGNSWTASEVSNLRLRIGGTGSSSGQTKAIYFYGANITINYSTESATVTTTLTGSGTITPSGATSTYAGETFTLEIVPANNADTVTVTNGGTDVTSQLTSTTGGTIAATAESFTTSLSASNANFYTSSSSTGNYFNYAVGHTAESPGSTSTSYNTYVKDNGNNTATGYAEYSFDFSDIPTSATITSVQVKCYGACENTTHDSTHKAEVSLYSGSTQKGTTQNFTSTSNTTMTISDVGTWTATELHNAKLRFTVAYYGGRLFGITWTVVYTLANIVYTYTYTVSGTTTIAVTIGSGGGSTTTMYLKVNGSWVAASAVYKKVNGSWVQQSDLSNVFTSGVNYLKG